MAALRSARPEDVPALTAIYNDEVLHGTGTFDTVPKTEAEMGDWLKAHGGRHPVIVAEEGGKVVGWASLSAWSGRCAYARSAEVSVYVEKGSRGRGLSGVLLDELLTRGRAAGVAQALARITDGNEASLRLHRRRGFADAGLLKRVGEKFGRVLDVRILQKPLEEAA